TMPFTTSAGSDSNGRLETTAEMRSMPCAASNRGRRAASPSRIRGPGKCRRKNAASSGARSTRASRPAGIPAASSPLVPWPGAAGSVAPTVSGLGCPGLDGLAERVVARFARAPDFGVVDDLVDLVLIDRIDVEIHHVGELLEAHRIARRARRVPGARCPDRA